MIKVLFFARLREDLKTSELDVSADGLTDINSLVSMLVVEHGGLFDKKLNDPQIIAALNHEKVDRTVAVNDGDEVAFFPPVTGG